MMNNFIRNLFIKKEKRIKLGSTGIVSNLQKYKRGLVACPFCGEVQDKQVVRTVESTNTKYIEVDSTCKTCHSCWLDFYENIREPYGIFN